MTPMTPPQDQQQGPIQSVGGGPVREQDKIHLVLAYLSILCLIPLLTVKDSPYVQWHAKQGLVLNLIGFLLGFIPVLGCFLGLGIFVIDILAILKALKGERWRIPLAADLSEKF